MGGGGRHRVVKDTCKQERKTQLQQVGRVRPSAERHNNGEAGSGRSSLGVARAGAKQQAAGRGWPGATPLQAGAGPRPLRARPPGSQPGTRLRPARSRPQRPGPPLHGAPTQQLLWPLALAQRQPPTRPRARGPCQWDRRPPRGGNQALAVAPALLKVRGTPSPPEGLTQADSRASALPTPQAHLRLMKRSKVAGAKWPPGDRWAQPLAP